MRVLTKKVKVAGLKYEDGKSYYVINPSISLAREDGSPIDVKNLGTPVFPMLCTECKPFMENELCRVFNPPLPYTFNSGDYLPYNYDAEIEVVDTTLDLEDLQEIESNPSPEDVKFLEFIL